MNLNLVQEIKQDYTKYDKESFLLKSDPQMFSRTNELSILFLFCSYHYNHFTKKKTHASQTTNFKVFYFSQVLCIRCIMESSLIKFKSLQKEL